MSLSNLPRMPTFTINDSVQCLKGNSFVFNCGQTALNYIWNCGDGFTTTLNSFNHSYLVSDTFKVKLKVMNSFNCFDSAVKKVYVNSSRRCHIFSE